MRRKILIRAAVIILVILAVAIALLPKLVKNYLIDYAQDLTGRKITLTELNLNVLKASTTLRGLEVYEKDGTSHFLDLGMLHADIRLWPALTGKYILEDLEISGLKANVIVRDGVFNFQDLLEIGQDTAAVEEQPEEPSKPVKWEVMKLLVTDSYLSYADEMIGGKMEAGDIRISVPGMAWDSDTIHAELSLEMLSGGKLASFISFAMDTMAMEMTVGMDRLNLEPLLPPLQDLMKVSSMTGFLSSDLRLWMNLNEPTDIVLNGDLGLDDFSLTDAWESEFLAVKSLQLGIDSLDVNHDVYNLKDFSLVGPYVLMELYEEGDNWSRLFPEDSLAGSTADSGLLYDSYNVFELMAAYIRDIARTYMATNYNIGQFRVSEGRMSYRDYTLQELFSYDVTGVSIVADQLNSSTDSLRFSIDLLMDEVSRGSARIAVDPQEFNDMSLKYDLINTSLVKISPYAVYYLAYPIRSAVLNYHSATSINDGYLKSDNSIMITGFNFGEKKQNSTAMNLPVKLAVALLKDVDGNIAINIPVEGDLNDPKFKWWKAALQVLKNLVVKAVTAPYRLLADAFGFEEKDIREIFFEYLDTDLSRERIKSLDALATVLAAKPEMNASLVRAGDKDLEGNALAEWEARKAYYEAKIAGREIDSAQLTSEVRQAIGALDTHDSLFVVWLDSQVGVNATYLPVLKKCRLLAGEEKIVSEVAALGRMREEKVMDYLVGTKQIAPERILFRDILPADLEGENAGDLVSERPKFVIRLDVPE